MKATFERFVLVGSELVQANLALPWGGNSSSVQIGLLSGVSGLSDRGHDRDQET